MICVRRILVVLTACSWPVSAPAGDWPQWRYDSGRSARAPQALPESLHLLWKRQYPPLQPAFWQTRQDRVQFDLGYEPVVAGKTLVVGSSRSDWVTALDTETGNQRWRFYTNGPVRLAPALWQENTYVASDDGCLYCLDTRTGRLRWSRRAAPTSRKVLGNGRLISVWPVRGGPVIHRGLLYLTAGIWPFEGIFVHALEAKTGKPVWVNDRCGSLYLMHPHGAMSFGGPSPVGYLLVHQDRLVVPSGKAFPAFFDLSTGALDTFDFGYSGHGSCPGGWFVATDAEQRLLVDPDINRETHDVGLQRIGQAGIRHQTNEPLRPEVKVGQATYQVVPGAASTIHLRGKRYCFRDGVRGVEGTIHTVLAADDKLFVVTRSGAIYCFGPQPRTPRHYARESQTLAPAQDKWTAKVERILTQTGVKDGYALLLGLGSGRLLEELLRQSQLHIVVLETDAAKIDHWRRRLDRAGLYGVRAAIQHGQLLHADLPPYLANLVVSEDFEIAGLAAGRHFVETLFRSLRPYTGSACLDISGAKGEAFVTLCRDAKLTGARVRPEGELAILRREGPPAGASDYTGEQNFDQSIHGPLGLLWFGDTYHHHKLFYKTYQHNTGRGLPPNIQVVQGVIGYQVTQEPYGPNPPAMGYHQYLRHLEQNKVYQDARVDAYTGRLLAPAETTNIPFRKEELEPTVTANLWTLPPERRNPLTGLYEGRGFLKTYGCDQSAVDYGNLLTMRSGTPAYYDKLSESGTVNISGLRSGCRNNIVPADGVLSLPSWTGNCTCNYPLHTSLTLVPMPEQFEQWAAWGNVAREGPIGKVGINLGAPGDRVTRDGTLWLDVPSVGGPSPEVPIQIVPEKPRWYYRHSTSIAGGEGWPWVLASGVEGLQSLRIEPIARKRLPTGGTIGVRWAGFLEPQHSETYTFYATSDEGVRLWLGEKLVLDNEQNLRRGKREEISGTAKLTASAKTALRLEYYGPRRLAPNVARRITLKWSSPTIAKQVVPSERLYTLTDSPGGLSAAYYDTAFSGPSVLAVDSLIDFRWGPALPPPLRPTSEVLKPHPRYAVELYFAEPEPLEPGQRVFSVTLNGKEILSDFDIVKQAGGPKRGLIRRFDTAAIGNALSLALLPKVGQPILCGLRLQQIP